MADYDGIKALLEKLTAARFSGTLTIRIEAGEIASAELRHHLPFAEFNRELPTIEPGQKELEFSGKP